MALHVILGKGTTGTLLAERLLAAGHEVRVLSCSGGGPAGTDTRAVDASDAAALRAAAAGADVLYNCANPQYTADEWEREWPPVATALLDAAEDAGAVLVTLSNLYVYGEPTGPMTETTPMAATGRKGRVRAAMWEQALERHQQGRVRVAEARASDFVGPEVVGNGFLGERVVPRVLRGKGVQLLGALDQPHTFTDVRAVAATLEALGAQERAWGRVWHVPSAAPITQREGVAGLAGAAGTTVRVSLLPHAVLRVAGLVVPVMRELEETRYQWVRPFVMDSTAAQRELGLAPVPLERTWADTVAWWRQRLAAPAAA